MSACREERGKWLRLKYVDKRFSRDWKPTFSFDLGTSGTMKPTESEGEPVLAN